MGIELVLGSIGTVLGIVNIFYWAWWIRRDRIIVVNAEVYPEFIPNGSWVDAPDGSRIMLHNYAELSLELKCELVLMRGHNEIDLRKVEVVFDKTILKNLKRYFTIPFRDNVHIELYPPNNHEREYQFISIFLKKTAFFQRKLFFNCSEGFLEEIQEREKGYRPESLQDLLDEMAGKYQVIWTRCDGSRSRWKVPDRWYRNLGNKTWG